MRAIPAMAIVFMLLSPAAARESNELSVDAGGGATGALKAANVAFKLGLLGSAARGQSDEALEIRRGVELARAEYEAAVGHPVDVVAAATPTQWEAGTSELVRIVYDEGVGAVLGPVDSRMAHLAAQVAARCKGRLLLLTPWATDPSLTRAKVPWFYRLAHDDLQQAEAIVKEIRRRELDEILLVVSVTSYDCRTAATAFERVSIAHGLRAPRSFCLGAGSESLEELVGRARAVHPHALLLYVPPVTAASAVCRLRAAGVTAPFFGPLALATRAFMEQAGEAATGTILAAPADDVGADAKSFRAAYRKVYGCEPSVPAAYGYDGAITLIDALRSTGTTGEPLRKALATLCRNGPTGTIEFDTDGNRAGPAPVAQVQQGRLRRLIVPTETTKHPLITEGEQP